MNWIDEHKQTIRFVGWVFAIVAIVLIVAFFMI